MKQNGKFNTLIKALEATGLDKELTADKGIFCIYAPTDDAFAKLGDVSSPVFCVVPFRGVDWVRRRRCIRPY